MRLPDLTSSLPRNAFKDALTAGQPQIGLWLATADGYLAEMLAGTGFDWLLIDGEHAPNDLRAVLAQLQAIASAASTLPAGVALPHPVVRLPSGDPVLVKQFMELGAQTLLVPMVDTPEQALTLARAMRYPPSGTRGMGSGLARSSRWNRYRDYIHEANDQACLLVQVETVEGLSHIDAIAATPGVDGVFIGPVDLSTSMGYPGQVDHPEVVAAIAHGIARTRQAGKAAGICPPKKTKPSIGSMLEHCLWPWGVDINLLALAAQSLAARFRHGMAAPQPSSGGY